MPPRKTSASAESVIEDKEKEDLINQMLAEETTGVVETKEEEKDVDDAVSAIMSGEPKVMIFMRTGSEYETCGVNFTREHPFQLLRAMEAEALINDLPDRFVPATKIQVEEFYV